MECLDLSLDPANRQIFQQHSPTYADLTQRKSSLRGRLFRHVAEFFIFWKFGDFLKTFQSSDLSSCITCGIIDKRSSSASSVGEGRISVSESGFSFFGSIFWRLFNSCTFSVTWSLMVRSDGALESELSRPLSEKSNFSSISFLFSFSVSFSSSSFSNEAKRLRTDAEWRGGRIGFRNSSFGSV